MQVDISDHLISGAWAVSSQAEDSKSHQWWEVKRSLLAHLKGSAERMTVGCGQTALVFFRDWTLACGSQCSAGGCWNIKVSSLASICCIKRSTKANKTSMPSYCFQCLAQAAASPAAPLTTKCKPHQTSAASTSVSQRHKALIDNLDINQHES